MSDFPNTQCDHPETRLTYRIYSNGSRHFAEQCQTCGRGCKSIKKNSISPEELLIVPQFDDSIVEAWEERYKKLWANWNNEQKSEREKESRLWWDNYNAYLLTKKWRDKRDRVLQRDSFMCQACLKRQASEVHHLTYKHVRNEPLFDLVSVCSTCHVHLHQRGDK